MWKDLELLCAEPGLVGGGRTRLDTAHQLQHQGITTRAKRRGQFLCLRHSGSHLLEMDSLCIQDIWGSNQHYSSLTPLQRNPRESWGESSKAEQRKRRKPHNAESLLSQIRQFPAATVQIPVRNTPGHILRVRWQPGDPGTSLCSGRGLVPAAVASACLTQCITSQSGSEENHRTKPQ